DLHRVEDATAGVDQCVILRAELWHLQRRLALRRRLQKDHLLQRGRQRIVERVSGVRRGGGCRAVDPAPLALVLHLDGAIADGALAAPALVGAVNAVGIEEEDRIAERALAGAATLA